MAGLARLQEEKLATHRRAFHDRAPLTSSSFSTPPPPTPPLLPSPTKPAKSPPPHVRRLSPEEMTMQREKELCFNYDEKFTRGHKCSSWFFLLIVDLEDDGEPSDDNPNTEATSSTQLTLDPPQDQISFYALSGHLDPETCTYWVGFRTTPSSYSSMAGACTIFCRSVLSIPWALVLSPHTLSGSW